MASFSIGADATGVGVSTGDAATQASSGTSGLAAQPDDTLEAAR